MAEGEGGVSRGDVELVLLLGAVGVVGYAVYRGIGALEGALGGLGNALGGVGDAVGGALGAAGDAVGQGVQAVASVGAVPVQSVASGRLVPVSSPAGAAMVPEITEFKWVPSAWEQALSVVGNALLGSPLRVGQQRLAAPALPAPGSALSMAAGFEQNAPVVGVVSGPPLVAPAPVQGFVLPKVQPFGGSGGYL